MIKADRLEQQGRDTTVQRTEKIDTGRIIDEQRRLIGERIETTLTSGEVLAERVHELTANTPIQIFLGTLAETGKLDHVEQTLTPYAMERLQTYLTHVVEEPDCANFAEFLTPKEQFMLALLFAKSPQAATHSLDVYRLMNRAFSKMPSLQKTEPTDKALYLKGALLHDLGKVNEPDLVFGNPIKRDAQAAVYRNYIAETKRPPIESSAALSRTETEKFAILLKASGDLDDAARTQLADEYLQLLQARKVDIREVLPTNYLLDASAKMTETRNAPEDTLARLDEQAQPLSERKGILALYEIPPAESLKTSLNRHELESVRLIKALYDQSKSRGSGEMRGETGGEAARLRRIYTRVMHLVSRHHNNPETKSAFANMTLLSENPPPPQDAMMHEAIVYMDITAALLLQERPYSKKWTSAEAAGILREEAQKRNFGSKLVEEFISTFLSDQAVASGALGKKYMEPK